MEFKHKPVLLTETIDNLCIKPEGTYVDGTLGGGGHAYEVVRRLSPQGRFIGIDQDADAIRAAGKKCGAVICPETPVDAVAPLADGGLIDEVLVMTVHPGFGGQKFLESGLPKFRELRRRWPELDLSVDGGINTQTGALCAAAGANILGAGSFLYKAADMKRTIAEMRAAAEAARG